MITYDDVPYELDETASGLTLCLPLPGAKKPQPYVFGLLRMTGGEAGPERGEFIGQDTMILQCPVARAELTHWSELDGVGNEQKSGSIREMMNRLIMYAEDPRGRMSELAANSSICYTYSLRAAGGFRFFLELEGLFLPMKYASQCMFGFGDDKPSEDELWEMCESLKLLEELPLWSLQVSVPAGVEDKVAWAQHTARERLGMDDLRVTAGGKHRAIQEPERHRDPEMVKFITPWAEE